MDGDENSAYFHKVCIARRRYNFIAEIQNEENISLFTDDKIKATFLNFFHKIYISTKSDSWLADKLDWRCIDIADALQLIRPFEDQKVFECINSMSNNKTPRSDGFTIEFFKKNLEHLQS